jgi:hypothetical protein
MNADKSTVLQAVADHINREMGQSIYSVFDTKEGLDTFEKCFVVGTGSRKNPYIYLSSCYDVKATQHRFCFSYGDDYSSYLGYNRGERPNTEINVGKQKTLDAIARDVYKRLFVPCHTYFLEKVKPQKVSSDNYKARALEQLTQLHAIAGGNPPILGMDRFNGEYHNNRGYARNIYAGSSINMELSSLSMDKALQILRIVYNKD